jgi:hypothetical protein
MEDPVAVFGRHEEWGGIIIPIPNHIYHHSSYDTVVRPYWSHNCVFSSMVVERSHIVSMIDCCIKFLLRITSRREWNDKIGPLRTWKAQLVLERIRRNVAARTIQRQFRESMSNPAYDMCKRRLLREFAEGI